MQRHGAVGTLSLKDTPQSNPSPVWGQDDPESRTVPGVQGRGVVGKAGILAPCGAMRGSWPAGEPSLRSNSVACTSRR